MDDPNAMQERGWRNRPVWPEIDDRRVRQLGRVVLSLAVAALPTAVYLLQQNESLKVIYELNDVRSKQEKLAEEERRLSLETARLESLARIEKWAVRDHGLVRPGPDDAVVVREAEPEPGELMASTPDEDAKDVR